MAQVGHCCTFHEDCESLICIGGGCWAKQDPDSDRSYHVQRIGLILLAISALLLVCCIASVCCMQGLKQRINGSLSNDPQKKFPEDGSSYKDDNPSNRQLNAPQLI